MTRGAWYLGVTAVGLGTCLSVVPVGTSRETENLVVVENWSEELTQIVPSID